jgi:alkylation response protein AidB-like acyl-CoA dehydrogenase
VKNVTDKGLEHYLSSLVSTEILEMDGFKQFERGHFNAVFQSDFLASLLNRTPESLELLLKLMIRVSAKCGNLRNIFLVNYGMVGRFLSAFPNLPSELEEALNGLRKGERFSAIAITEKSGGSNPKGQSTRIERIGKYLTLSGEKRWITCGDIADFLLVQTWLDEELRLVYVPTRSTGLEVKKIEKPMGARGSGLAIIKFDRVSIEDHWLLPKFLPWCSELTSIDYILKSARLFAGASGLGIGLAALAGATKVLRGKTNARGSIYTQGDWQTRIGKLYIETLAIKGFLSNIFRDFDAKLVSNVDEFTPFKIMSTDFAIRSAQTYFEASGADAYEDQSEPNRLLREAMAGLFIEGGNAVLTQKCVSDWTKQSILGGLYDPF